MLRCDDARARLAAEADGGIETEDRRLLEQHLAGCAACREALAAQREVHRVLAARGEDAVPPGFAQRVARHAVSAAADAEDAGWMDLVDWRRWTQVTVPVAAALIFAAVLTGGSSTATTGETTEVTEQVVAELSASNTEEATAAWWRRDVTDEELLASMLGTSTTTGQGESR